MPRAAATGFTLIELLIVVAIIAILAAIAIPNMLEDQARAKTARVLSDLRSEATALEAYHVDNNAYPDYDENRDGREDLYIPFLLTSPVPYLSTIPRDPFSVENFIPLVQRTEQYRSTDADAVGPLPYAPTSAVIAALYPNERRDGHKWVLFSWGPDMKSSTDEGGTPQPLYDPTNGTTSLGEIGRVGP